MIQRKRDRLEDPTAVDKDIASVHESDATDQVLDMDIPPTTIRVPVSADDFVPELKEPGQVELVDNVFKVLENLLSGRIELGPARVLCPRELQPAYCQRLSTHQVVSEQPT